MKGASRGGMLRASLRDEGRPCSVVRRIGLSRKRLDVHALDDHGERAWVGAVPPDGDGLRGLARRFASSEVRAAIESMNGARFVHDQLELSGWRVEIADAAKVKGLAPLACKTDRIDAGVLAELCWRDLVPAVWLPDPEVRGERERARYRLYLVRHRTSLKNRIHSTLLAYGAPCPVSDLFGVSGRRLLVQLELPDPCATTVRTSLQLIDVLDREIQACEAELRRLGADHRYIPLLTTVPGIGWLLGYTIASEIGDIARFGSPLKLAGYTGLCPRVYQSGSSDRRGSLSKQGPRYLRWALLEATIHACRHPLYKPRYDQTKRRLGKQRGTKVARVELARTLSHAIWHMLTRNQQFALASAKDPLAA